MLSESCQGVLCIGAKTGSSQAAAQSPQKLHSRAEKSICGDPAALREIMPSGQARLQSPQPVQAAAIRFSLAQGGRTTSGTGVSLNRPRRKLRRSSVTTALGPVTRADDNTAGAFTRVVPAVRQLPERSRSQVPDCQQWPPTTPVPLQQSKKGTFGFLICVKAGQIWPPLCHHPSQPPKHLKNCSTSPDLSASNEDNIISGP